MDAAAAFAAASANPTKRKAKTSVVFEADATPTSFTEFLGYVLVNLTETIFIILHLFLLYTYCFETFILKSRSKGEKGEWKTLQLSDATRYLLNIGNDRQVQHAFHPPLGISTLRVFACSGL